MSQPAFIEIRPPYGGPKRLEWLLVQATAFNAGMRGGARGTDASPAKTANAASSGSPPFTPPSTASSRAASVRSPIPSAPQAANDNIADAPATPTLVPNTRIRLSRPPASPLRSRGVALTVVLFWAR